MVLMFLFLLLVLALFVPGCRSADENRARQEPPAALHHPAEVSPSSPSRSARLMDGMGTVDFAITTISKDAQAFFNQGIAQLYGFWYVEAEQSFLEAANLDPKAGTAESLKLLRQVLAKNPNHVGANHFLIHGLEGSKDLRSALPAANRYAALAPNIPHVLHMPGHVYAQIGRFDEAVQAFLAAAAKEREYMSADPHYSKLSYVHNEILLLHALGSQGRYRDAMARITDLMSAKENLADRQTAEFFY